MLPDIFEEIHWQMSPSERAAVKGVLADLLPGTAIEIGTAEGGSLRRIAAQARHVHAFDLNHPDPELAALPSVTFHIGDSHELLPRVLEQLAAQDTNVDFVLVDGDHSTEGIKRDVEDLLASPAIARTLILLHDTANPVVRSGLETVMRADWPKLAWVDLDWLPGFVSREGPTHGESWSGLGVMIVDAEARAGPVQVAQYAYPLTDLLAERGRDDQEHEHDRHQVETLHKRVEDLEQLNARLVSSTSWRLTRPLRSAKKRTSSR